MRSLDINLLRSFVAISRSQSIKVAAGVVGRTQSAVSMQMQRLEDVVGQPILHRNRYGVVLTTTGERLLAHAKRILDEHDQALADITGKGLHGQISVGCPEEYLSAFFPDLLRSYSDQYNHVEIEVVCAPTTELKILLKQNKIDVALISQSEDPLCEDIIRHEQFVWVANSQDSALLSKETIPLALSAPDTLEHRAACSAIATAGLAYRIAFASNSLAGLLAITRSGQAISIITQSAVPDDLYIIEDSLPTLPSIGINLTYASARPSLLANSFGEFVKHYFAHIQNQ